MPREAFGVEQLKSVLRYDPETGKWTWRTRQSNVIHEGMEAGSVKPNGRRYINVLGEAHLSHRLAHLYMTGEWPKGPVRQRNGVFDDCRWDNLYESTRAEVNIDRRLGKNNTSGRVGVSYSKRRGKWKAQIKRDWTTINLGYFASFEEACAVRAKAEEKIPAAVSPEEYERHQLQEKIKRRQRVAWDTLTEKHPDQLWSAFAAFVADVGEPPDALYTVEPTEDDAPVGPGNFRWTEPPSVRFDLKTKAGRSARKREYYQETNEQQWLYSLKQRYGLSRDEVYTILEAQNHCCAICHSPEKTLSPSGSGEVRRISLDHDHKTDAPRGFLCANCNNGLGKLGDSILVLESAIAYLKAPPADAILARREAAIIPLPRKESA